MSISDVMDGTPTRRQLLLPAQGVGKYPERRLLGDEPPQRAAVSDRPDWIASAGLPHSVFGGTRAHRPPLQFGFKLPTEGLMNSTTNSRRRPEVASVRVA